MSSNAADYGSDAYNELVIVITMFFLSVVLTLTWYILSSRQQQRNPILLAELYQETDGPMTN
jgi:hypothetical protein